MALCQTKLDKIPPHKILGFKHFNTTSSTTKPIFFFISTFSICVQNRFGVFDKQKYPLPPTVDDF